MSGQWKKDAYASFTHNLLLILGLETTTQIGLVCLYECMLLTCLGILCRHTDEVQSTWRQGHGKDCPELLVSWAERAKENGLLMKQQVLLVDPSFNRPVNLCFV